MDKDGGIRSNEIYHLASQSKDGFHTEILDILSEMIFQYLVAENIVLFWLGKKLI